MQDLLSLLPRTIVSIRKRIDRRRIGAITLIVLGFLGFFTFSDRLIGEAQVGAGGGGQVLPALICTNSTIGTNGCLLPANGCDGIYRIGIGRCERSTNFLSSSATTITITAGNSVGSTVVNFSPAFTNQPNYLYPLASNTQWTGFPTNKIVVPLAFLTTRNFPWAIPLALTEFPGNQTDETVFNPSGYSQVQLSVTFSASTIPVTGSHMLLQISGDNAVSWTSLVNVIVDGTGTGCAAALAGTTAFVLCSDFANLPALPSLTADSYLVRIAGSGGDGTTKIQWSQIQAEFSVFVPPPPVSQVESQGPPGTSNWTLRIETSVVLPTGTSITVKVFWQVWSYTG